VGRLVPYVSEIERGHRGSRMNPLVAVTWAKFLDLDPLVIFGFLGIDGTTAEVRQYLETVMWGNRVVRARHAAREVASLLAELLAKSPKPEIRDGLLDAKNKVGAIDTLLGSSDRGSNHP